MDAIIILLSCICLMLAVTIVGAFIGLMLWVITGR